MKFSEKSGEKLYKKWEDELFRIYKKMNPDNVEDKSDKISKDDVEKVKTFINRLSKDILLVEEYEKIVASSIFAQHSNY